MMVEPEYITIIEGPTPEFRPSAELAINSSLEGIEDSFTLFCEMRTINGQDILSRCRQAWKEGRPVRLDFPDEMRLRQELDVVGLRLQAVDEGSVLQVWVRQPLTEFDDDEDDDNEEDDFDDYLDEDDDLGFSGLI